MEKLNDLSFKRLELVHEFVQLEKQLETYLTSARLNFSKARTLHGITLTNLVDPDSIDLVASVRINDKDGYKLIEPEDSAEIKSRKPKKDESSEEKSKIKGNVRKEENAVASHSFFRPFGVLEPTVAKEGRKTMTSAISIICEMATVQKAIKNTEKEMKTMIKEIDIERVIERLKI